ncbi:MAG: insulinase family protein [Candidatus Omnitrophica bacterium]|nr:insulinase family protein [Candidatus Omnitrophota bacterium]
MYKKTVFDNGLKLVTYTMPRMQSVSMGIWISVGGRFESSRDKGISHYLEHMLFKGSKKYSCRSIKESIEGVGGVLNGFTSEELTCYFVKIPARHMISALDVLSDMVLHPRVPESEAQKERTVILEEIKMYKDLPQSYVYELLDELLWPDQPLGAPIIGTEESVRALNREKLLFFKESFYTAANIVISAAGALDEARLTKLVKRNFSGLPAAQRNTFLAVQEVQKQPQLKVFHKETEQSHLALGFHGVPRNHSLRHAIGILHVILGGNMSSRLFDQIREKRGLAYEIGTQIKCFHDTGTFLVHAGMDNLKVAGTISLILEELSKAKKNLVTEDEFKRGRDFYLGQLLLALEDTLDHMLWIGESTSTLDMVYSLESITKKVTAVTREDIRRAAQMLFTDCRLNGALIGPLETQEDSLRKNLHF